MPDEVAAAFPIAYGTSHLALKHRGRLKKGETLVVHGAAGGVGLTAVEIGKALGARVIATASTPEKLEIARKHGADELVDSSTEDLRERIKGLTGGKGANVIYDPVGGDVFDASLRAIAFEGRLIVIGFAGGRVPQIPANHLMVKNVDAIGFNFGAYLEKAPAVTREAFSELAGWYVEGRIRPYVSDRFTLEETPAAIAHVMERRARGKAVVLVP
jgi:NADPH2:quinone reductase